jgi:hypothetical protein
MRELEQIAEHGSTPASQWHISQRGMERMPKPGAVENILDPALGFTWPTEEP